MCIANKDFGLSGKVTSVRFVYLYREFPKFKFKKVPQVDVLLFSAN